MSDKRKMNLTWRLRTAGFSIYKRQHKNGKPIFYAQFKLQDGTYSSAKSTGSTTRRDAVKWREDQLLKNGVPVPGQDITFDEFSKDFFDWNGTWAVNKRVRGLRISL